jgi:hypothetical protein
MTPLSARFFGQTDKWKALCESEPLPNFGFCVRASARPRMTSFGGSYPAFSTFVSDLILSPV